MDIRPHITVVTVVYNGGSALEETIQSVIGQTYQNKEYIVIDGGSNDGSIEVIKKYEGMLNTWISEKDKGIYDAMNKAITLARGSWINFMNCGDRFTSPDVLSAIAESLTDDNDVVYGNAIVEYPGFNVTYPITPLTEIWKRMPFCHQASFVRTELAVQMKFDLTYALSADYDFVFKAYLAGKRFKKIDLTICLFDFTGGASKENAIRSAKERLHIVGRLNGNVGRRAYYLGLLAYLWVAQKVKRLVGRRLTEKITEMVRRKYVKPK